MQVCAQLDAVAGQHAHDGHFDRAPLTAIETGEPRGDILDNLTGHERGWRRLVREPSNSNQRRESADVIGVAV